MEQLEGLPEPDRKKVKDKIHEHLRFLTSEPLRGRPNDYLYQYLKTDVERLLQRYAEKGTAVLDELRSEASDIRKVTIVFQTQHRLLTRHFCN